MKKSQDYMKLQKLFHVEELLKSIEERKKPLVEHEKKTLLYIRNLLSEEKELNEYTLDKLTSIYKRLLHEHKTI